MLGTRGFSQGTHRTLGALHLSKRVRLLERRQRPHSHRDLLCRHRETAAPCSCGQGRRGLGEGGEGPQKVGQNSTCELLGRARFRLLLPWQARKSDRTENDGQSNYY